MIRHFSLALLLAGVLAACASAAPEPTSTPPPSESAEPEETTPPTEAPTAEPTPTITAVPTLEPTGEAGCLPVEEVGRIRFRGGINAADYRDGLTAVGADDAIYLYEGNSVRWSVPMRDIGVTAIAFAGEDVVRALVFQGEHNYQLDLDVVTGEELRRIPAKIILHTVMSENGEYYLTFENHNEYDRKSVIDATTGEEVAVLDLGSAAMSGAYAGTGEDWFGRQAAVATQNGVTIWDAPRGELLTTLTLDEYFEQMQIGYSTDGRYLTAAYAPTLAAESEYQFAVWEVNTGELLPAIEVEGTPTVLEWWLDSGATYASNERYLFRIEEDAAYVMEIIPRDVYWIKQIHLTADGPLVQTADRIELFSPDWESSFLIAGHWHTPPGYGWLTPGSRWQMSPDGRYFDVPSVSHHLIYELDSGRLVGIPPGRTAWGPGAWSAEGRFASGTQQATLHVWQRGGELTYHTAAPVFQVAWVNAQTLAVALAEVDFDYESTPWADHSTYSIQLFDLSSATNITTLPIEAAPVQMSASPDGTRLAIITGHNEHENGLLRVWSLPSGEEQWRLPVELPDSSTVSWSPAGDRLLIVDMARGPARLLDAASGDVTAELDLPGDTNPSRWHWDADRVQTITTITGYEPARLHTWDVQSGKLMESTALCAINFAPSDVVWTDQGVRLIEFNFDDRTLIIREFAP